MHLIKNGNKYYTVKNNNSNYGIYGNYYTIINGRLLWANPNIYLQSSGTQYIDTGLKGYLDFKVSTQGILDNTVSQVIISRQSPQGNWFGQYSNTKMWSLGTDTSSISYLQKGTFNISFQNKKITYTYNNTTYEKTSTNDYSNNNIYLFCCNSDNKYYATAKLWYSIAYENNTKIQHLVPVPKGLLIGDFIVPSNGMFDIVEQKFYENKGTGEFVIGGIPPHYIIEGGRMVWCNPDIYLESSGTQRIDSGITRTIDKKWEFIGKFNYSNVTTRQLNGAQGHVYVGVVNGYLQINNASEAHENITAVSNTNYEFDIVFDCPNNSLNYKVGNTTSSRSATYTNSPSGAKFYLFSLNDNVLPSSCKISYWGLYENNIIMRYFVPVPKGMLIGDKIASSNCMFDMVTQQFFENQGTGDFIIGGLSGDYINVGDNIVWVDENVYLQFNGAQYIDTEFKANQDTSIKFEYTPTATSGDRGLYCSRDGRATNSYTMFNLGANTRFDYNTSLNTLSNASITVGDRRKVYSDKNKCYIDDTLKYTATYANFQSNYNLLLGCSYVASSSSQGTTNYNQSKYHYVELYDNSKLIRYFLPVNTNTVIGNFTVPAPGMWDAVNKKFYPNKGSGTFTYGKDN